MARAVGIKVKIVAETGDLGAVQVKVHNAGRFPIELVEVLAATEAMDGEIVHMAPEMHVERYPLGTLLPGDSGTCGPSGPPNITDAADVPLAALFTDTWDQRWMKVWNGVLARIQTD